MIRWENTAKMKTFFSDDFNSGSGKADDVVDRFSSNLPAEFMRWDPLSRAQYIEIKILLSNYLLSSQGDRMAMGHSVEGRYPFLDYRVVDFACSIPPELRLNVLKDKFILRRAANSLIPSELALRPKQPYRAPISRCFMAGPSLDYVEDLLSEYVLKRTGYFNPAKVLMLSEKCRKQDGALLSERENMALVGIISTQLLDHQFIRNFPAYPIPELKNVRVFAT
jgi:asparagine synthase (glutamine-hydrolysing)